MVTRRRWRGRADVEVAGRAREDGGAGGKPLAVLSVGGRRRWWRGWEETGWEWPVGWLAVLDGASDSGGTMESGGER